MKNMYRITLVAVSIAALLTGCATTRSDSLGLVNNEATKTYAAAYQPARDLLNAGNFDEIKTKMLANAVDKNGQALTNEETHEKLLKEASELSLMERGLLSLNMGEFERALFYFDIAEEKLNLAEDSSSVADTSASLAKSGLAMLTGASEMADYEVRSYEKVMLLNYKALCHMLLGDRKAYNVTRRAIDLQQEEWEKFQQKKAKFEEDLAKKGMKLGSDGMPVASQESAAKKAEEARKAAEKAQQKAQQQQARQSKFNPFSSLGFGGNSNQKAAAPAADPFADLSQIVSSIDVDDRSKETKKKAGLVASAYVNPFGDYMNALLQEFDSLEDTSLRDNARISYEKVVQNNKDCKAAKVAQKNVMKGIGKNKKLVQVILSDGFAPYQLEKSQSFTVGKYHATLNFSNATPVETPVAEAQVKVGNKTVKMSSLTRMESIILRDEQDNMPWRAMHTALALVRSALANEKAGALGGLLAGAMQHPDTRSWLTLPNQVLVSRIVVPANQNTLELSTVGKDGKTLTTTQVEIAEKGPSVVYAVNYGSHLKAYANAFSWVK